MTANRENETGVQDSALQVLESWARDRYGLRWALRAEVLKFIKSYQVRPGEPRPFVGRATLLRELDQWLLQGEDRLRLLSGAAGRGKSALLLHWLGRLIQRGSGITIFYLPISIRFNTASESAGLQLLFAALRDVFSDLAPLPQQPEIQDYLAAIRAVWQQMALRPSETFLVVVDGLDEAIQHWFLERHVLPTQLPPNLHVLLAARHKPGHPDGAAWLEDLAAGSRGGAQLLELGTLEPEAMAEAVIQLGHPLDRLAERQVFLQNLYRLAGGGDPLLLTLWLGQIWRTREALPDLNSEALARLQPGFGELYRLWGTEQQSLWAAQGLNIQADAFKQVMHVLALAQGRLLLEDLVAVLGFLDASWDFPDLRAALETAHRLVVSDETGYVLVHPRLAQHLQEELETLPDERDAVRAAFRHWGARTVQRLNSGELQPEECPAYLLTHYVPVHLSAGAEQAQTLDTDYLPLLGAGWPWAWYAREGAWDGYLNDLTRIASRVHELNEVRAAHPVELRLAPLVRCALMAATIRSIMYNLPTKLLAALAREGVWSIARAARVANQYEPSDRVRALIELAALATGKEESAAAQSLLQEALETAVAIKEPWDRGHALINVAARFEGENRHQLLQQALEAMAAVPGAEHRAFALASVAEQARGHSALLRPLLNAAEAIDDPVGRASALSCVAAQLQGEAKHTILQQALDAAVDIKDGHQRGSALAKVAEQLHGDSALLQRTLSLAQSIQNEQARVYVLSALAEPSQVDHALLQQVLAGIAAIENETSRSEGLRWARTQLHANPAFLQPALNIAAALKDPLSRALALSTLAAPLQGEARQTILQQAMQATEAIQEEHGLTLALRGVVACLEGDSALWQWALRLAGTLENEGQRVNVLNDMLEQSGGDSALLQQLLGAIGAIQDPTNRVLAQLKVASKLPGDAQGTLVQQGLAAAEAIEDPGNRVSVLCATAAGLQGEAQREVLSQAFQMAAGIQHADANVRYRALEQVADASQGEARRTALQLALGAAAAIQDEGSQVAALMTVADQLQGRQAQRAVLQQALQVAAAIHLDNVRADGLRHLSVRVHADSALLQQALELAAAIHSEHDRACALSAVALQLQGEARHRVLEQALELAAAIVNPMGSLKAVAARLQGDRALLQRALHLAATLDEELSRGPALRDVAQYLQADSALIEQTRQWAATISDAGHRAGIYLTLARQQQGDRALLQEILETVAMISEEGTRAGFYLAVAEQLQGEARHTVLQQALGAARATGGNLWRAELLSEVAAQLEGEARLTVLREALEVVAGCEEEHERSNALKAMAGPLQGDRVLLQQALQIAAGMQRELLRAHALTTVAAQSRGESRRAVLQQALEAAVKEPEETQRATALFIVAEQLQGERGLLHCALDAAGAIGDMDSRAHALRGVAEQLSHAPELQALCLERALTLPRTSIERIELATTLLRQNPSLLTYGLWFSLLSQARLSRAELLRLLGDLTRCAVQLTGRAAEAEEIANAIGEVCAWFP